MHIAAVYDPDRERAQAVADACSARVVDSLAAAAAVDAGIAALCSPPREHVAQAEVMCRASADRIVFVEKPVATSRAELERIRVLPGCVPILQWRAGRALRALRRAVAHGELGSAPVVSCDLAWGRDDEYFRLRQGWGCGAVLSIGIHVIDAIRWVLDREVETTASLVSAVRDRVEVETAAVALLRFEGNAMASLRISLDGGGDATRITMCGAGKTVHLEGRESDPTCGTLRWSTRSRRDRERLEALERDTPGALGSPLLVPYLGEALAALRDGERPGESRRLPSIEDTLGAHTAAISIARVYDDPSSRRTTTSGASR